MECELLKCCKMGKHFKNPITFPIFIIFLLCSLMRESSQASKKSSKLADDVFRAAVGKSRREFARSSQFMPRTYFEKPGEGKRSNSGTGMAKQRFIPISSFIEMNSSDTNTITFLLYSLINPSAGQLLMEQNLDSFYLSSWALNFPVKILVHDYRGNCEADKFSLNLRAAYLSTRKLMNIVCMDWKQLANEDNYFESAAATNKVGKRLADFISFLKRAGYIGDYRLIHVIGFGLGAHIAGIAGSFINDRKENDTIFRITGLDPSGPGFESVSAIQRLDADDAAYVDVIHTNMGSLINGYLGTPAFSGHADYFPNGGTFQPSCGSSVVGDFISTCSHQEAYELFQRSIKGTKYHACKCQHWLKFMRGECGDCKRGPLMGESATKEYEKTEESHGAVFPPNSNNGRSKLIYRN